MKSSWSIFGLPSDLVLLRFSVACFRFQGFGGVSPYVCSYYFQFGFIC